jgi:hypothetical protein
MIGLRFGIAAAAVAALVAGSPHVVLAKTFVIPHILEASGTIQAKDLEGTTDVPLGLEFSKGAIPKTPVAIDTVLDMTYVGGLTGVPGSGTTGATVALYLYDEVSGGPLKNNGQDVCNPCDFSFSTSARKQSIRIDDLISAKGGSVAKVTLGFGIIVVGGADPDGLSLQVKRVTNIGKHFDLSVFGFTPQEISAPAP